MRVGALWPMRKTRMTWRQSPHYHPKRQHVRQQNVKRRNMKQQHMRRRNVKP
jgi:hypothetical protein